MTTEIKDLPNLFLTLKAMLGRDELVTGWWDSPNRAFDLKTPRQQFADDSYVVVRYVLDHIQR